MIVLEILCISHSLLNTQHSSTPLQYLCKTLVGRHLTTTPTGDSCNIVDESQLVDAKAAVKLTVELFKVR